MLRSSPLNILISARPPRPDRARSCEFVMLRREWSIAWVQHLIYDVLYSKVSKYFILLSQVLMRERFAFSLAHQKSAPFAIRHFVYQTRHNYYISFGTASRLAYIDP